MTYTIINEQEKTTELFEGDSETIFSDALAHLGYFLQFSGEDSVDIKEYNCVDVNGDLVFSFLDGFYENACLYALTELDYSVDEGDWTKQPENVIVGSF
jgi:hypothetical protein